MMKNGIALIITLGLIAIITAIVLNTVTLVDKNYQNVRVVQSQIQNQLILTNVHKALSTLMGQISSADALYATMGEFPGLSDDSGKFVLGLSLQSAQGRVNINGIFTDDNQTLEPAYERLMFRIFQHYEVTDPDYMTALIADTIDLDTLERLPDSERINREAGFSNGAIKSHETLKRLSNIYAQRTRDTNIYKVEWKKFFFLGPLFTQTGLDCDYLSWDLAELLPLKVDAAKGLDDVSCDAMNRVPLDRDQNDTITSYNIAPFTKGSSYLIQVGADFEIEGKKGKFSSLYDLKDKRISDISLSNTY